MDFFTEKSVSLCKGGETRNEAVAIFPRLWYNSRKAAIISIKQIYHKRRCARQGRWRGQRNGEGRGVNKQIFSLLSAICASPYMTGDNRLNSQYARVEMLYDRGDYHDCVAACSTLFEQLMGGLYRGVTGVDERLPVILSDIVFWQVVDNKQFCDTAGLLQYACCRLTEGDGGGTEPEKAARLAISGLDRVIGYADRFLALYGREKCLDPAVLARADVRARVARRAEFLRAQLEGAGCRDGVSMQPPHMNACLIDAPERETRLWARFIAARLHRSGLLSTAELRVLDADQVVTERVGMTNEFIRRAAAGANGAALLIEHMEEFDMPCAGGSLIDRALRTALSAAELYRGSLCIILAGRGDSLSKALHRDERSAEFFPLTLSFAGQGAQRR